MENVPQVEREKSEVEQQLSEVREKLEEAERERERVKKEMDGVRKDCEQETRRCREDAERAKETQTREKESFDAQVSQPHTLCQLRERGGGEQVTELCGMLERYRNENQKIVQQKEQHIQSLQSSLELARQNKAGPTPNTSTTVCVCVCVCVWLGGDGGTGERVSGRSVQTGRGGVHTAD